jgi:AcrR family transcriptional regulator
MHTEPVSPRMTAEERRAELVDAAVEEFAQAGLAGASTEAIARRAGISHAYLFRLYPTKRALFAATVDDAFGHVLRTFQEAYADRDPAEPVLRVLGHAYIALIEDRSRLLFQLHAYAACGDEDIRTHVRERYTAICSWLREVSGRSEDDIRVFMSTGLLLAVGAAIDAPDLAGDGSFMLRALGSQPSG